MITQPSISLELALALHRERIASAEHRRRVAEARRARDEPPSRPNPQPSPSITLSQRRFGKPATVDLADWIVRTGDTIARYPVAELAGHRRRALGVLVDGLLGAARDGGTEIDFHVGDADSAVVLLRALGRLAARTAGGPVPVSRRRARMLRAALEDLVDSTVEPITGPRRGQAA